MADKNSAAIESVYDSIVESLTDKGYRVVDKATAEKFSMQIAHTHDIDPVLNKAAAYGLLYHAEYTLYYKVNGILRDDSSLPGALMKVRAKIIDNTGSQIMSSKNAEASSTGLTMGDAVEKASASAGKKVIPSLMAVMEKGLDQRKSTGNIYTIVIDNVTEQDELEQFEEALEKSELVASVREMESGGGKTTFEFEYRGKRDKLDKEVTKAAKVIGWTLKKVRSEGNRSTWKNI